MKFISKMRKKTKGFTLVEIIVVLVILAILAAFTIPAMLGFVNDAKGKGHIAEAREIYVAAQAAATEKVATQTGAAKITGNDLGTDLSGDIASIPNDSMDKMLEDDIPTTATWTVKATGGTNAATGKIEKVEYTVDGYTVVIDKTASGTGTTVVTKVTP